MKLDKRTEVYLYLLENGYRPELDEICHALLWFNKKDLYKEYAIQLTFSATKLIAIHYTEEPSTSAYRQCLLTKDFTWLQYLSLVPSQEVEDFLVDLASKFL